LKKQTAVFYKILARRAADRIVIVLQKAMTLIPHLFQTLINKVAHIQIYAPGFTMVNPFAIYLATSKNTHY